MPRLPLCCVWLSVVAAAGFAAAAYANDTAVSFVGGAPRAVDDAQITLTAEHLRFTWVPEQRVLVDDPADCPGGGWWAVDSCVVGAHWAADLEYVFVASAELEPRTVEIGLPFELPLADTEHMGPAMGEPIEGVTTLIDGEPAAVRVLDDVLTGDGWAAQRTYLVSVAFAPGQQRTLTHRYEAYGWEASGGSRGFRYLLRTGAGWAGSIGSLRIEFELPARTPCVTSSLPHRLDERRVVVELTDWEPDADLELTWAGPELLLFANDVYAASIDDARAQCAALAEPARSTLHRRIALWFGAPSAGDPSAAALAAELPVECLWADAFAARAHTDAVDPVALAERDAVRALRYQPSSDWAANLAAAPPWIRACHDVTAPVSQPAPP